MIIKRIINRLNAFLSLPLNEFLAKENVALNRSAWQLHPYSISKWSAEKAVDGLKSDLSANGGQCTVSANYKTTAEWKVYLGGVFKIHRISIHYRTDNLQWSKIYFLSKQGICQFSVSFIFVGISFHFLTKNMFYDI